jgi:methionyl-tRNA formyltransferase
LAEKGSIIFMGSPDFAVRSLEALYKKGIDVKAVVTQPDKEQGRGKKIGFTPVKSKAVELGLPVLQPKRMKDLSFIASLKEFNADLFVVVAFRVLPAAVFSIPPFGSINLHASLLPDYRGAAPINHAIFNGEKETGLTVFFLNDSEIDSGDIAGQLKIEIGEDENFGSLYERMAGAGAQFLTNEVVNILNGRKETYKQPGSCIKNAPKLFAGDFRIDWDSGAESVFNRIRGLSPKPGAFCVFREKRIKLIEAKFDTCGHGCEPGKVIEADRKKGLLKIAAKSGTVIITKLQPENKPVMDTASFLNGHNIREGEIFT